MVKEYDLKPINTNTLARYLKDYDKNTIILSLRDEGVTHMSEVKDCSAAGRPKLQLFVRALIIAVEIFWN